MEPPAQHPKDVRKTMSVCISIRKPKLDGFPLMLVGYMRVSKTDGSQVLDLQRDALLSAGVDARHLFEDRASGAKDDRPGLPGRWHSSALATCSLSGSWIGSAARCRICWPS